MEREEIKTGDKLSLVTNITVKAASDKLGHGEIEVIVSNSAVDRHGESILVDGIDLKEIKKNPVVLWAHDYVSLPIAKITKLWKRDGNLYARMQFATEISEFADTVYKMVVGGFINAVSIGGIVRKWKNDDWMSGVIEKLEMIELSVVPVGAHQDALVIARGLGIEEDAFKKQYEGFLQKGLIDKIQKQTENKDTIKLQIDALKSLISALEAAHDGYSADTEVEGDEEVTEQVIETSDAAKTKLVLLRQVAKQCDKQSELIIAAINNKLKNGN